jgi:hypothetical protein
MKNHFETAATHNYIMGVEHNGKVTAYAVTLDFSGFCFLFSDKPTESKRATVVKYRSNKAKREYLASHATAVYEVCTIEELKSSCRVKTNRYGKTYTENCGECFEWLMAKLMGGRQNDKANLKYTDGGDITVNGIAYQVKYERAGITVG